MKLRTCGMVVLLTLFSTKIWAQEKARVYEVPTKFMSLLLVADPNSPLRLSKPRFLKYEEGPYARAYSVSNVSNKTVVRFQIKELSWLGGQESTKNSWLAKGEALLPTEAVSAVREDELEFLPFTENALVNNNALGRAKDIWIILVTHVEMEDGTVYDVSSKYEQLEKFVGKLMADFGASPSQVTARERELREFVSKMFNLE